MAEKYFYCLDGNGTVAWSSMEFCSLGYFICNSAYGRKAVVSASVGEMESIFTYLCFVFCSYQLCDF